MPRPLTRVNRWGANLDMVRRPSHFCATASVRVASPDDVLSWLCLCEYLAGGFSSPLMRAGRLTGNLYRVHMSLLPGVPGEGVMALTFTSSKKTELTNLSLIHRAMAEILVSCEVTAAQWRSAALRVKTRMMTGDSLARRSPWHRSPYDAALVDPLSWAQQNPPDLEACRNLLVTFVQETSEQRVTETKPQHGDDRVRGRHEHT